MTIRIKKLGLQDYEDTYSAMRVFTDNRTPNTEDEIWLLEHAPVYTLGLSNRTEHLLDTQDIPVVQTDRGGQATYHGPGQLLAYLLIDLTRRPYAIKTLIRLIESAIIDYLSECGITAARKPSAPGVYTHEGKIAALGVRVKKGCSYHGLALNVDMDLKPFKGINPCGYKNLPCTQVANYKPTVSISDASQQLPCYLLEYLDKNKTYRSNVA